MDIKKFVKLELSEIEKSELKKLYRDNIINDKTYESFFNMLSDKQAISLAAILSNLTIYEENELLQHIVDSIVHYYFD